MNRTLEERSSPDKPPSASAARTASARISAALIAMMTLCLLSQVADAQPNSSPETGTTAETDVGAETDAAGVAGTGAIVGPRDDTGLASEANKAVKVALDRQRAAAGAPVTLTLSRAGAEPISVDLSPLETDFRLLDRAQVSDLTEINGRREERQRLRLTLLPRRSGKLTIPPLQIDGGETVPITLEVAATATTDARLLPAPTSAEPSIRSLAPMPPVAEQIQVEASADLNRVLVGQQVVLSVLVIGDGPLPPGRLILPSIDGAELLILGEDRRIDPGLGGVIDGADGSRNDSANSSALESSGSAQQRWIFERRYALFPSRPGRLEIPPSVFSAWRPGADGPEELSSTALTIEVMPPQPLPSDAAPNSTWLPAAQLTLSEAGANLVRLAPGQVIERMITLAATGLRAEDLPPIRAPIPFQLQLREDPPRLWNERGPEGVIGYRTERITLSSAEPGLYRLPAVAIDWWNVDTAGWERASLPEWQLQVAPLDSSSRRPAPDWRRGAPPGEATADSASPTTPTKAEQPWVVAHWRWFVGALALLLVTWLLRRRARRGALIPGLSGKRSDRRSSTASDAIGVSAPRQDQSVQRKRTAAGKALAQDGTDGAAAETAGSEIGQVLSEIEAAYASADTDRARAALLAWGELQWPERAPGNLSQLSLRLPEPLAGDIRLLDKAFFSPSPLDWSSRPVAGRLKAARPGD
jgi:hypothetical protein